jgi:hypothetical protein
VTDLVALAAVPGQPTHAAPPLQLGEVPAGSVLEARIDGYSESADLVAESRPGVCHVAEML